MFLSFIECSNILKPYNEFKCSAYFDVHEKQTARIYLSFVLIYNTYNTDSYNSCMENSHTHANATDEKYHDALC